MEGIDLAQLKSQFPTAYARLPAKLARASFITDGKRISTRVSGIGTWVWDGKKWSQVASLA